MPRGGGLLAHCYQKHLWWFSLSCSWLHSATSSLVWALVLSWLCADSVCKCNRKEVCFYDLFFRVVYCLYCKQNWFTEGSTREKEEHMTEYCEKELGHPPLVAIRCEIYSDCLSWELRSSWGSVRTAYVSENPFNTVSVGGKGDVGSTGLFWLNCVQSMYR